MHNRDLLTLQNLSSEEIWQLLETARGFKYKNMPKRLNRILSGKSIILLFQKPSTRTRVSFEVAINQLGGYTIYLGWNEAQLGRGETIEDTARVLSRYVDGIVARVFHQSDLEKMARYASIPIVNALSDLYHPCQVISDLYTIWEKKGSLRDLKLAYIGDGNNVCNSLLIGCSKMGVNIAVACPPGYEPYEEALKRALENAKRSSSSVELFNDPIEAVKDADIIYTDTFVSMSMEDEQEKRLRIFLPKFQVTSKLFTYAAEGALFMHCLPAHRNEEVADDVIDGARSIVWDQAENRLHTAEAIMTHIFSEV